MRVDQRAPLAQPGAAGFQRRAGSGERFSVAQGPARSGAAAVAAGLASVDALLALQGEDPLGERRRRQARRGHDLLDRLDRLKAALLGGLVPAEELTCLAAGLAAGPGPSGDPRLDEVLGHIELRAAVELAKLGAGERMASPARPGRAPAL